MLTWDLLDRLVILLAEGALFGCTECPLLVQFRQDE